MTVMIRQPAVMLLTGVKKFRRPEACAVGVPVDPPRAAAFFCCGGSFPQGLYRPAPPPVPV